MLHGQTAKGGRKWWTRMDDDEDAGSDGPAARTVNPAAAVVRPILCARDSGRAAPIAFVQRI